MMRVLAVVVLVSSILAAGAVVERGDGPAPSAVVVPTRTSQASPGSLRPPGEAPVPEVEAVLLAEGLDRPTAAVEDPRGRLFVAEKTGVVNVVVDGAVSVRPVLDLDASIPDTRVEQGLLGLALHPGFDENRLLYVDFTDLDGNTRILEYRIDEADDGPVADLESAREVMRVDQPGQYHNGGMLQFGPDGYLYASFGDGHFGDPQWNARDIDTVLGSIIRIDVDAAEPYAVPSDNPFVGVEGADEVWLYGVRNPWRFWIDPVDRVIVVGDVGQFAWEEVTVVPLDVGGLDLGWPIIEAEHCYAEDDCDPAGMVLPDLSYGHSVGCAVVGGPVYRGSAIPEIRGMVVYADFCGGFVRAFGLDGTHVVRHVDLVEPLRYGPILSLAVDADGEVLILTQSGEVRRLQPSG